MGYTFEILGVSPVLYFFSHQQQALTSQPSQGVEYLTSYRCTLDALIASAQEMPSDRGWDMEQIIDTVVDFWMNNFDVVRHWKKRMEDAGDQSLLISRLANGSGLRAEFERLLDR